MLFAHNIVDLQETNKSELNYSNTEENGDVWLHSLTESSLTSVVLIKSSYSWQKQQGKVCIGKMGLNPSL